MVVLRAFRADHGRAAGDLRMRPMVGHPARLRDLAAHPRQVHRVAVQQPKRLRGQQGVRCGFAGLQDMAMRAGGSL